MVKSKVSEKCLHMDEGATLNVRQWMLERTNGARGFAPAALSVFLFTIALSAEFNTFPPHIPTRCIIKIYEC